MTEEELNKLTADMEAKLAEMNARQDVLDRRAAEVAARYRHFPSLNESLGRRMILPRPELTELLDENSPSEFDDPLRRGGRSSGDDAGGASVPAVPVSPRPTRRGGAARTFAEMDEPPRDP